MDTKLLRQKILDLAIRGKLVPQDPNDEPASVLLERIKAEKEQLIKDGKIKRPKKTATTSDIRHYPFELPNGWVWTTLGEISNYGLCTNVPLSEIDNGSWILELEDLEKDTAKILKTVHKESRYIKGVRHKFYKGEILYSKLRTYLNKVLVAPKEGFCTTEIIPFTTFGNISNQYICHVLRSKYFLDYTHQCGYGVKMPRLSTSDANKALIPIPPLKEQVRITCAIANYFNLIECINYMSKCLTYSIAQVRSKILDLAIHGKLVPQDPADEPASELLKRVNPNAEITSDNEQYGNIPQGWLLINLGFIFDAVSAKRIMKSDWKSEGVPFYRAREIVKLSEYGRVENELFIDSEYYTELKDKYGIPQCGDIMLSAVGTIGKCYIVRSNDKFYYKDASVLCLRNIHNLNSKYFSMLFSSSLLKNQMSENSKGTTVDTITLEKLKSYVIPLPPLAEQQRIVSKIEELFTQLDNIENSLQV